MTKERSWPIKLGLWLILLALAYGAAHLLVTRLQPAYGLLLTLFSWLLTLLLPLGFIWLRRRHPRRSLFDHYALVPLDSLPAIIIFLTLLFLGPFVLYRSALFQWGTTTSATVVEQSITSGAETNRYILVCRFRTTTDALYTVSFGVSRAFYNRLAPGETVTVRYLPIISTWPWAALVEDPYTSEARLLTLFLWGALLPPIWFGGAALRASRDHETAPA